MHFGTNILTNGTIGYFHFAVMKYHQGSLVSVLLGTEHSVIGETKSVKPILRRNILYEMCELNSTLLDIMIIILYAFR